MALGMRFDARPPAAEFRNVSGDSQPMPDLQSSNVPPPRTRLIPVLVRCGVAVGLFAIVYTISQRRPSTSTPLAMSTIDRSGPSCLLVAPHDLPNPDRDLDPPTGTTRAAVVLAGGCFWCTEAIFRQLDGVHSVVSGYAGGDAATADYKSVCTGQTGHAEVIRIEYDPATVSYGQLLKVFFSVAHDPTTLNRQGNDRGTQYRSAIFYQSTEERAVAEAYIRQLMAANAFAKPIVTTLEPLTAFYPAEAYHQNYAAQNPDQPYISAAAQPKVEKVKKYFSDKLRRSE
jgi:peptide-methionine (S)-S-oxide reductase